MNRHNTNVIVDDRTLYEIYLPAFKAAVQAGGAWSVMSSYNLYEGRHAGQNRRLLDDILRGETTRLPAASPSLARMPSR